MPDTADITAQFWRALRKDMTVMLGLDAPAQVAPRPMTAQIDGDADHGPIWFFTSQSAELTEALTGEHAASFTFVTKGHDLWATVSGRLSQSDDTATVDRLWNPHVAAWYAEGKDDPDLALLRFDPVDAQIWLDGSSLVAGVKALFGTDPKEDYKDKVAKVSLA